MHAPFPVMHTGYIVLIWYWLLLCHTTQGLRRPVNLGAQDLRKQEATIKLKAVLDRQLNVEQYKLKIQSVSKVVEEVYGFKSLIMLDGLLLDSWWTSHLFTGAYLRSKRVECDRLQKWWVRKRKYPENVIRRWGAEHFVYLTNWVRLNEWVTNWLKMQIDFLLLKTGTTVGAR